MYIVFHFILIVCNSEFIGDLDGRKAIFPHRTSWGQKLGSFEAHFWDWASWRWDLSWKTFGVMGTSCHHRPTRFRETRWHSFSQGGSRGSDRGFSSWTTWKDAICIHLPLILVCFELLDWIGLCCHKKTIHSNFERCLLYLESMVVILWSSSTLWRRKLSLSTRSRSHACTHNFNSKTIWKERNTVSFGIQYTVYLNLLVYQDYICEESTCHIHLNIICPNHPWYQSTK